MEHAGEIAKRYLEWAKQQSQKPEPEPKTPAELRDEMLEKLGIKR